MKFYLDEALNYNKQNNNQAILFENGDKSSPIAVGFFDSEALKISIRNSYEQIDGILGSLGAQYNSVRKTLTKYSLLGSYGLKSMDALMKNAKEALGDSFIGDLASTASDVTNWLARKSSSLNDIVQHFSQRSMDSADAYMTIFSGTGVSVPLNMYQYLITDSIKRDINDELKVIVDKLIGKYEEVKLDESERNPGDEGLESFVGFTSPPHGFETKLSALTPGKEPKGTLTLYLNNIRFRGLVVEDIDIERSKTRVIINGGKERPLWIRIDYSFKAVVKYTDKDVIEWLGLNG